MKKLSILLYALLFTAINALADGYETLCFSGKMGGRISFIIAFDYHELNESRPSGYIYYPNAKNPSPILIVGTHFEEESVFVFNEYQPDGTISGTMHFKVDGFDEATGPYIVDGEWTNPVNHKSFALKDIRSYNYYHGMSYAPEWFDHPVYQRADPSKIGKRYSYKQWHAGYNDYMGGHVSFRGAGKNKVAFEICNAPNNIAEGKSAPGRPAVLEDNHFKYDNVNECGYGFECEIYDKYLVITSTTDPKTFNCFGAFTTFEGVYIKVED